MSKKSSYWSPAAVVGRYIWSHGGFKGAMRRLRREWFGPREVARYRLDPKTGKPKATGALRQKRNGSLELRSPRKNGR